jgi:replicative DNA helicase
MTGILVDITDSIYTTSNARSYIDILRKKSVQRSLIYAGDHIARLAYEDRDVNDLVIDAQKSIRALDNNNGKTHKIANLVMKLQDEIEDVLLNGDTTIYFDTGIDDIKLAR